jgi:hypothetical protein
LLAYILQSIVFSIIQLAYPIPQFDSLGLVQATINGAIAGSLMGLISGFVVLRYYGKLYKSDTEFVTDFA